MQNKNSLLRQERLRRGWSQLQLSLEAGVSLSTVERAERGEGSRIDSIQRLCACLDKTPEQLDLLNIEDNANFKSGEAPIKEQDKESEDAVNRREALKNALKLGIASIALPKVMLDSDALNRLEALLSRSSIDMPALKSLESVTQSYWQLLYGGVPKRGLLKGITGHLESVTDFLAGSSTTSIEQRLYSLASQQTQMAGEIYFDLHDYDKAKACTKDAIEAAQRSADPGLYAVTLARMSFLCTYSQNFQESLNLLSAAHHLAKQSQSHAIRYWIAAVEAEVYAKLYALSSNSSTQTTCIRLLDEAESIATISEEDPYRINFDPASLAAYKGVCFRYLHKPKEAQRVLQTALASLGSNQFVSRANTLTDLASSYAQQGEVEEACICAGRALTLAERARSINALGRILEFRNEMEQWSSTPYVEDLDGQLAVTRLQIA